jgi:hypothetical protein
MTLDKKTQKKFDECESLGWPCKKCCFCDLLFPTPESFREYNRRKGIVTRTHLKSI